MFPTSANQKSVRFPFETKTKAFPARTPSTGYAARATVSTTQKPSFVYGQRIQQLSTVQRPARTAEEDIIHEDGRHEVRVGANSYAVLAKDLVPHYFGAQMSMELRMNIPDEHSDPQAAEKQRLYFDRQYENDSLSACVEQGMILSLVFRTVDKDGMPTAHVTRLPITTVIALKRFLSNYGEFDAIAKAAAQYFGQAEHVQAESDEEESFGAAVSDEEASEADDDSDKKKAGVDTVRTSTTPAKRPSDKAKTASTKAKIRKTTA